MAQSLEYMVALQYMGRALQSEPDIDFLRETAGLTEEFAGWAAFEGLDPGGLKTPRTMPELESFRKNLAADHLRLFSGPEPIAPPWESVWRERDKLLFGGSAAQTAKLYADWGLAIIGEGRQPADHLGLEVSFLGWLLQQKSECPACLSLAGQSVQAAIDEILNQHIMQFAPAVLEKAAKAADTVYYSSLCSLCLGLLGKLHATNWE